MVKKEKGTIFKDNTYYNSIIDSLEELFSSRNFGRNVDKMTEKVEEIDRQGNLTGKIVTREYAHNFGIYHRTVSLFIINENNAILLQKRSNYKIRNSGLWDVSASGHVRYGEDDMTAVLRECYEETKYELKRKDIKFLVRYKENIKFNKKFIDNSWFNVYVAKVNTPNEEVHDLEVSETKFVSVNWLKKKMKTYEGLAYKPKAFEAIVKYIEDNKNNTH